MSPLRIVLLAVVGLILLVGIVAAGYYVSDGAVEATVTDKQCGSGGGDGGFGILGDHNRVKVRTTFPIPGISHTVTNINDQNCLLVEKDNHVRVHLRSERTSIWEYEGGPCVWDTEFGPNGCDL